MIAESLLPSTSDDNTLKNHFAVLVSRVLAKHFRFFSFGFEDVVEWHIQHKFSVQMAEKSVVVSNKSNTEVCLLKYNNYRFPLGFNARMRLKEMTWWTS